MLLRCEQGYFQRKTKYSYISISFCSIMSAKKAVSVYGINGSGVYAPDTRGAGS